MSLEAKSSKHNWKPPQAYNTILASCKIDYTLLEISTSGVY